MTEARVVEAQGALFDFDGVLVSSTVPVKRHWRTFAQWYDVSPERVLSIMHGRRSIDTIRDVLADIGVDEVEIMSAWRRFEELDVSDSEGTEAMPGARELLDSLEGRACAVVTSGSRAVTTARFASVGLPQPRVVITGDDIDHGKPDPAGYKMAASRLGVDAKHCLVVEDAPSGVSAGLSAGAQILALTTTHDISDLLEALNGEGYLARDLMSLSYLEERDQCLLFRLVELK